MTIEELKKCKNEKGYTYAQMSELSGVPVGTIQKIFTGETSNPRYDTMLALENIFEEPSVLREETAAYKLQGQGYYTIEDYYALPSDIRVELIDGVFYDMAAPNLMHQDILFNMAFQLKNFINKNKGPCKVYMSPFDVRLDCDDKTMVQPDVMVVCDIDKRRKWGLMGAPDFVIEVISPSTKNIDYALKAGKYMNAKVREYWIIDPYKKMLIRYDFENDSRTTIGGLNDPVPVGIFDGKLEINFDEVVQMINEFENLED